MENFIQNKTKRYMNYVLGACTPNAIRHFTEPPADKIRKEYENITNYRSCGIAKNLQKF